MADLLTVMNLNA